MIWFWVAGIITFCFCFVAFFGAPYLPTFKRDLDKILKELELPKNSLIIDLGSGDGRLLVLAAKKGYRVIGYEINPILWLISSIRIVKYPNAKVRLRSFWRADVSQADLVFTFLLTKYMAKLEAKLEPEMKPGSYLASYVFELPNTRITKKSNNIQFYRF